VKEACLSYFSRAGIWFTLLLLLPGCGSHEEQPFPSRPITIICPPAAGGLSDSLTRAIAAAVQPKIGVPVVVENKPGGANAVGMTYGANAQPDGYTVTYLVAELAILPHLHLSPIHIGQFEPLARTNYNPAAVTVQSGAKWKTLKDFIQEARSKPGSIAAGNSGTGSVWHIAAVALQEATGIKLKHVPFGGAAPAVQALLGGHVDVVCVSLSEVQSQVEAGNLRVLALMADEREPLFPDIPTAQELGYSLQVGAWGGLAVPLKTPPEIQTRLLNAFREAFRAPEFVKRMNERGVKLAWLEPEPFRAFVQAQSEQNRQAIAALNLDLREGDVGHNFFPLLLGILGGSLCLFRIGRNKHTVSNSQSEIRNPQFAIGVLTLLYILLLPVAGFLISTVLFLAGTIFLLHREQVWLTGLTAIAGTALLWWLFFVLLKVPLP
jgi:tripartite-type tricarboxylate transporter receptor subunit TctC